MATKISVNAGSGNGLLPNGTKPIPKPVLNCHQWSHMAFTSLGEKCQIFLMAKPNVWSEISQLCKEAHQTNKCLMNHESFSPTLIRSRVNRNATCYQEVAFRNVVCKVLAISFGPHVLIWSMGYWFGFYYFSKIWCTNVTNGALYNRKLLWKLKSEYESISWNNFTVACFVICDVINPNIVTIWSGVMVLHEIRRELLNSL